MQINNHIVYINIFLDTAFQISSVIVCLVEKRNRFNDTNKSYHINKQINKSLLLDLLRGTSSRWLGQQNINTNQLQKLININTNQQQEINN